MKLLTKEIEQKFAEVGSQEHLPDSKKKVIAKFFDPTGFYTWYALEYDPKYKEFFGYVKGQFSEYGYFGLEELEAIQLQWGLGIERDIKFGYDVTMEEVKAVS